MKKLLLGSIALTLFSVSILLFQISCKKEVTAAQEPAGVAGVNQLGLIMYKKMFSRPSGTPRKESEFWIANIDGTNPRKIPIVFPQNLNPNPEYFKLSPNGKTIIFSLEEVSGSGRLYVYSCSIDGSGLKRIIDLDNEYIGPRNQTTVVLGSVN